jgi:hypothetical protein
MMVAEGDRVLGEDSEDDLGAHHASVECGMEGLDSH